MLSQCRSSSSLGTMSTPALGTVALKLSPAALVVLMAVAFKSTLVGGDAAAAAATAAADGVDTAAAGIAVDMPRVSPRLVAAWRGGVLSLSAPAHRQISLEPDHGCCGLGL